MLTPGHQQPEELSSSCYGKGWHGFSRRHGGTPGSQPHWRCTQPDSSTAPSTGRSVMAAAAPLPRPWWQQGRALGAPSHSVAGRCLNRAPTASPAALCSPAIASRQPPSRSRQQGRARCRAQRPHRTERAGKQPAESHLQLRIPSRTQNAQLFTL